MNRRNWTVRGVYLYLVCLVALGAAVVGVGGALHAALDLLTPLPADVERVAEPAVRNADLPQYVRELEREHRAEERGERTHRDAVLGALGGLTLAAIAAPIYWLHWRRIRREEGLAGWGRVEWSARNLYYYVVCFVALVVVMFNLAGVARGLVTQAFPGIPYCQGPAVIYRQALEEEGVTLEAGEIGARVERQAESGAQGADYWERRAVFRGAATVIIAAAVYLYHWRRVQRDYARD